MLRNSVACAHFAFQVFQHFSRGLKCCTAMTGFKKLWVSGPEVTFSATRFTYIHHIYGPYIPPFHSCRSSLLIAVVRVTTAGRLCRPRHVQYGTI